MQKTTKWLVGLVVALMVVNIALVATIWLQKKEREQTPQRTDAKDYLVQSLSMTDAQVEIFDSLRKGHFEQIRRQKEILLFTKDRLFKLLSAKDTSILNAQLQDYFKKRIGEVQAAVDLETFTHFRQLRAILTPAQQEKFDTTIQQVLRTMTPPAKSGTIGN